VKLHIASQYESLWIGSDRSGGRRETLQVLRAHQDGVDRYIAIATADPGADVGLIEIRALENCRVGRVRRDVGAGLLVVELLFDLVLRIGQTHLIRYEVVDRAGRSAASTTGGSASRPGSTPCRSASIRGSCRSGASGIRAVTSRWATRRRPS